ncbi:MAG: hypothetical protein IPJ51_16945 [Saprospiraceae bacterium]|nr:hypothetical protein [Saprospiraceae bacterium]
MIESRERRHHRDTGDDGNRSDNIWDANRVGDERTDHQRDERRSDGNRQGGICDQGCPPFRDEYSDTGRDDDGKK